MITYDTSSSDKDISGIINLQRKNLPTGLTKEEMESQGFVTVVHSMELLRKMNSIEQSIIARDEDEVIAYLLAMTPQSKTDIPVLIPMFEMFDQLSYSGKRISDYNYIVVGQVCIDKKYRGQGLLDNCYAEYRNRFKEKYDFAITEIATKNQRSMQAHKRIGFETIHEYKAPDKEEWSIVLWKW